MRFDLQWMAVEDERRWKSVSYCVSSHTHVDEARDSRHSSRCRQLGSYHRSMAKRKDSSQEEDEFSNDGEIEEPKPQIKVKV